jgi:hypothetical protein
MNSPVLIPLTRGLFATIDAADADAVRAHAWWAFKSSTNRSWYARTKIDGRFVSMQNFLMQPAPGMLVDHVDLNGLNNRRDNLRPATRSQNHYNRRAQRGGSSRFKGVSFCKLTGKWRADICAERKPRLLGRFDDEEVAARAYDIAALALHGAFARLNFPGSQQRR